MSGVYTKHLTSVLRWLKIPVVLEHVISVCQVAIDEKARREDKVKTGYSSAITMMQTMVLDRLL